MNHIKYDERQTWCRAPLSDDFYFKDVDHVITNNFFGKRLPCEFCLRKVITALLEIPPHLVHLVQLTQSAQNSNIVSLHEESTDGN